MQFTTTRKEQTMKTTLISTYLKLGAVLATLAGLAATGGAFRWSDETLKQDVQPVDGALARLRRL
jgi:hypothetical protein